MNIKLVKVRNRFARRKKIYILLALKNKIQIEYWNDFFFIIISLPALVNRIALDSNDRAILLSINA